MTEARKNEMCMEYAKCEQNILSSSAERRMAALEEEARQAGLRFEMVNKAQYMMAHSIVAPKYELV